MTCKELYTQSFGIKTSGTFNFHLKAVDANGEIAQAQDWHAVRGLTVGVSNGSVSGVRPVPYTIDTNDHSKITIGGSFEYPVGRNVLVVEGAVGNACFAATFILDATENGTASVNASDVVLTTLAAPEDEHSIVDLVADLSATEGLTTPALAIAALNGKTIEQAFGEGYEFAHVEDAFRYGKSIQVIYNGGANWLVMHYDNAAIEDEALSYTWAYLDSVTADDTTTLTKHTCTVDEDGLTAA